MQRLISLYATRLLSWNTKYLLYPEISPCLNLETSPPVDKIITISSNLKWKNEKPKAIQ